jgi:hypothetical protein
VIGIWITAGGSTIRGLVLSGFSVVIRLQSGGGNLVEGCYSARMRPVRPIIDRLRIQLLSSNGNTIGGTSAAARNLISGNDASGIVVQTSNGATIQGNLIGTDVSGALAIPNGQGISLPQSTNVIIGGAADGARNVLSGNLGDGILISYGSGHVIQGNFIGTDITGTRALGSPEGINDSAGTSLTIGGAGAGEGNLISGNPIGVHLQRRRRHPSWATSSGRTCWTLPVGNITGIMTGSNVGGIRSAERGPAKQRHCVQRGIPGHQLSGRDRQHRPADHHPRKLDPRQPGARPRPQRRRPDTERPRRRRRRAQRPPELSDPAGDRHRRLERRGPRQVRHRPVDDL